MAFSEIYVDPSIAADSGTGTIGDPFGDLEYAIEQTTFDTTNGTRFNIKSGTDEILQANLDDAVQNAVTTPAYVPSNTALLVFQGYTAVAGDGGIGGIDGNGGAYPIFLNTTIDNVHLIDLHLHNCAATGYAIQFDDKCSIQRCKVGPNINEDAISLSSYGRVYQCYVYGFGATGVVCITGTVEACYIDGTNIIAGSDRALYGSTGARLENNIVIMGSEGIGIQAVNGSSIVRNSVYANAANIRQGIASTQGTNDSEIANNLIEGFSGVGGIGIYSTNPMCAIHGNAVYNCTTAYSLTGADARIYGDNETLSVSPFTDAANGDFSPVDTGNVKEGSLPNVIGGGFV